MADFFAATQQIADMQQEFWQAGPAYWSGMSDARPPRVPVHAGARTATGASPARHGATTRASTSSSAATLRIRASCSNAVESAPVDEKTKAQLRFGMRQFIDAMSPANFLATNPEAMQLALETGGQSLTEGMNLFFEDLAKGRISMTDEKAFEVGSNLAVDAGRGGLRERADPADPVRADDRRGPRAAAGDRAAVHQQVLHPRPAAGELVRRATRSTQGHTVFLVSWRNVDAGAWAPDLGRLPRAGRACRRSTSRCAVTGADQVNALGFCVGGTLLASRARGAGGEGRGQGRRA